MGGNVELWPLEAVEAGRAGAANPDLITIAAWTRTYLLEDHPLLGRAGPVCPYSRTAIERDLYLLAAPPLDGSIEALTAIVPAYRDAFTHRAAAIDPRFAGYLTIVLVLSAYRNIASVVLDAAQSALKDAFVRRGLMIGQFHPDCTVGGIYNVAFRALRAPIPLLAIRAMVKNDRPFLVDHPSHLAAYEARFGGTEEKEDLSLRV